MKRILTAVILFAVIAASLTGCSDQFYKPVESLMKPPSFSGMNEALIKAFEAHAGEDAVFSPPSGGEHKSAIVTEDIDSDSREEALIFYSQKNESHARVSFFDYIDGEWRYIADFGGSGDTVDSVKFVDMDGNGKSEVLVSWRVGTTAGRILSVYVAYSDSLKDTYKEIANESYEIMTCTDFDSDGLDEVFIVSRTVGASGNQCTGKLLKYNSDSIVVAGNVRLDANVSKYTAIKTEKIDESTPMRVYIDALKGEEQMITEVVYWNKDSGELVAPFFDAETMTNSATLRYQPVGCMDVNNDGTIDIPVQTLMLPVDTSDFYVNVGVETPFQDIYLTEWMNVSGNELVSVKYSVINSDNSYMFFLEEHEIGTIFVKSRTENCWVFYAYDEQRKSGSDLFSVLSIPEDEWNEKSYEQYVVLYEGDNIICAYISSAGKAIGIDSLKLSQRVVYFKF